MPANKEPKRPSLLAPIILNAAPKPRNKSPKGPPPAQKSPNPNPNLTSLIDRRSSRNINPSTLADMEPPPIIPAAVEEQGYRSRPASLRWKNDADYFSDGDGFTTPTRRGSAGTESTTAWTEPSPAASSAAAGPSNSTRARRRMGGFFRSASDKDANSMASADGGDEMELESGAHTPSSRHSVNYINRGYSEGEGELETPTVARRPGFFQRLKTFGAPGTTHGRSLSGWTVDSAGDGDGTYTPGAHSSPGGIDEGAESERAPRRTRSFSPPRGDGTMSAPTTPRFRSRPRRRATMTPGDDSQEERPGGRTFSRRASFKYRVGRRQSRDGGERPPYMTGYTKETAAKWRALKAGIKMIGRRTKEKVDQEKSAELVAELSAGTPAALILASMFQRDEHGNRRIPILLEQLKVRITESKHSQKGGRLRTLFKLELEYGSGLTRMEWTIWRGLTDFANLHGRYKVSNVTFSSRDTHRLPKFPSDTIPYLRGVRGLGSDEEDDGEGSGLDTPGPSSAAPVPPGQTDTEGAPVHSPKHGKRRPFLRRLSSTVDGGDNVISAGLAAGLGAAAAAGGGGTVQTAIGRHQGYALRQRQQLEDYLRRLIRQMVFRADSNRLCKFLELSALGVRLASEGSYHGKEGYLIIRSTKGIDFRRQWNPHTMAKRHQPKWFLVRHSYIVCVDSPEEMNIYDVFLVDSNFAVDAKKSLRKTAKELASAPTNAARSQHHSLSIKNHERTLKLLAKNERQLLQFRQSIQFMKENTIWAHAQRFDSFAPVRTGVFAQWLVDGRDYFWNVSRAISMAKDVIYIHDWWLSPELYLRRPAAVSQKWRLDRLLQRKAQEGVKIFVIVYRNIGAAIPIDSSYTKYSLLDLHPNVYVQRSPNQLRQQTFFWAHHEKILVVDHMIAFVGGIDLCFGRWDTPQHSLTDDKPSGFEEGSTKSDPDSFQLWPGKDYSNPRVLDFYDLDQPYGDMYDRAEVPRMPWHDIHMQVVGQPARDLTRHFVQRWNYLLRQRTPSRPTPLLLPQPDFVEGELESLGIDGTCEVQILRSASTWSIGTPNLVENSIQKAYIKSIELSEHLVYIENQFFITSCEFEGTVIENRIGDALVERIIRAYNNDEDWRAIIIIPLMPGFQNAVDANDGTSVRLIMHCQFRSISQGESSIYGRLRANGIEPDDYIQFFSLRNWGKIGPDQKLTTEQLYIHAKCMVVDDRIAIIGSANINERSMTGTRDSEVAAIVRDTDAMDSMMAGRPYKVGRFPHTLRVRLMREHLGVDVDSIMQEERMEENQKADDEWDEQIKQWNADGAASFVDRGPKSDDPEYVDRRTKMDGDVIQRLEKLRSFNHDVDWEQENNPNLKARKKGTQDPRVSGNALHRADVKGFGADQMIRSETERASLSTERSMPLSPEQVKVKHKIAVAALRAKDAAGNVIGKKTRSRSSTANTMPMHLANDAPLPPFPSPKRVSSYELGLPQLSQLPALPNTSDADIGGPINMESYPSPPLPMPMTAPKIVPDMFQDPINDSFYLDVWTQVARNNTEIYRQVFRCQPDNEIRTWQAYKDCMDYGLRFDESQVKRAAERRAAQNEDTVGLDPEKPTTPTSQTSNGHDGDFTSLNEKLVPPKLAPPQPPSPTTSADTPPVTRGRSASNASRLNTAHSANVTFPPDAGLFSAQTSGTRRRRRGTTRSSRGAGAATMDLDLAEKSLEAIQGHLVFWPSDWLGHEQETGNWLYNIDQLAPIEIYD